MDKLKEARRVFDIEIDALEMTRDALDEVFVSILDMITGCKGKVIITGVGKPGHIATKIAATLSSLGTPSFYLHPTEALHGDLGSISSNDVVIAISYSGESEEITRILQWIKILGAKLVAITGNADSTLAKLADIVQVLPKFKEACRLGLAPTSSTTVELCYGDALAVTASAMYGFKDADFGKLHPAGALGKRLAIRVKDLMASGEQNAIVYDTATLKDAIVELSEKKLGMVNIINEEHQLVGIMTGGDLCRVLEKNADIYMQKVVDIMKKDPVLIKQECLAAEALSIMRERHFVCMPVVDKSGLVGTITMQSIMTAGIVC